MAYDLTSHMFWRELLACPILTKIREDNARKAAADAVVKARNDLDITEAVRDVLEHKRREANAAMDQADAEVIAARKRLREAEAELAKMGNKQ